MNLGHALRWSLFGELATKLVQPLVFIILARLLAPTDFGVMAAALMVIGLSQVLWDAGMAKALIQRQGPIQPAANVAFWTNLALGTGVAALLVPSAAPIAREIFDDLRVGPVLQVMALHVLLGAFFSVHTALLQKQMRFQQLFWIRFASVVLQSLASLPLAFSGTGYWSLVAGSLTGQMVQAVLLWKLSGWRPTFNFDSAVAREMARFAGWVAASGLLLWAFLWLDSLIVAFYLGSHQLGLYNTASQLTAMVFAMLFAPVAPVLYSHLSRMGEDRNRIAAAATIVIRATVMVAVPTGVVLASIAAPLSDALFGPRWEGIAFVIGVLAVGQALSWIVGMNGEFFRALGKPSRETMINALALPLYLAGYLVAIRHGFETFVWTRLALTVCGVAIHLAVLHFVLRLEVGKILGFLLRVAALSGSIALGCLWLLPDALHSPMARAAAVGVASIAVIGGVLLWTQRHFVRDLLTIARAQP